MKIRYSIAVLLPLLVNPAHAAGEWTWVRATPIRGQSYWVTKGSGTVILTGQAFRAMLTIDPSAREGADIRLEGKVVGNAITAVATYLETDAGPQKLRGTIRRFRDKDGSLTEEISLTGERVGTFVGITRYVSHNPKPN